MRRTCSTLLLAVALLLTCGACRGPQQEPETKARVETKVQPETKAQPETDARQENNIDEPGDRPRTIESDPDQRLRQIFGEQPDIIFGDPMLKRLLMAWTNPNGLVEWHLPVGGGQTDVMQAGANASGQLRRDLFGTGLTLDSNPLAVKVVYQVSDTTPNDSSDGCGTKPVEIRRRAGSQCFDWYIDGQRLDCTPNFPGPTESKLLPCELLGASPHATLYDAAGNVLDQASVFGFEFDTDETCCP